MHRFFCTVNQVQLTTLSPRHQEHAPKWLPKQSFDISLYCTLAEPRSPLHWDLIGACYVYRPMGHFLGHISGTELRRRQWRTEKWNRAWCCGGTRQIPGRKCPWNSQHRWLGGYSFAGEANVWCDKPLVLPRDSQQLVWRTKMPDTESLAAWHEEEKLLAQRRLQELLEAGTLKGAGWHASRWRRELKYLQAQDRLRISTPYFNAAGEEQWDAVLREPCPFTEDPGGQRETIDRYKNAVYYRMPWDKLSFLVYLYTMRLGREGKRIPSAQNFADSEVVFPAWLEDTLDGRSSVEHSIEDLAQHLVVQARSALKRRRLH